MEVLETTGTSYPEAHELPNSTFRPQGKSVGRVKAGGNGVKAKSTAPPLSQAARQHDHDVSEANKMILLITPKGKRFVRLADYRAGLVS